MPPRVSKLVLADSSGCEMAQPAMPKVVSAANAMRGTWDETMEPSSNTPVVEQPGARSNQGLFGMPRTISPVVDRINACAEMVFDQRLFSDLDLMFARQFVTAPSRCSRAARQRLICMRRA